MALVRVTLGGKRLGYVRNNKAGSTTIINYLGQLLWNEKPTWYSGTNVQDYEGMTITELAQFTEYPKGGFYDWHMDADVSCQFEPPVRKISMIILLSNPSEFEGGDLEFMSEGNKPPQLIQGQAIFFCSMIRHRVAKVKKGIRRSLVMWFGGPPFK